MSTDLSYNAQNNVVLPFQKNMMHLYSLDSKLKKNLYLLNHNHTGQKSELSKRVEYIYTLLSPVLFN